MREAKTLKVNRFEMRNQKRMRSDEFQILTIVVLGNT